MLNKSFDVHADGPHVIVASGQPLPPKQWLFSASALDGVMITPSGDMLVNDGENVTYSVEALPGFEIKEILVDGVAISLE